MTPAQRRPLFLADKSALARTGRHRLPIADLLIAAVGEIKGLTILHYDKDFDTIAQTTGQPAQWIAPRGTL